MKGVRLVVLAVGLVCLWQVVVTLTGAPHYILPDPVRVFQALLSHFPVLLQHLQITGAEIMLGFLLGVFMGTGTALTMFLSPLLKRWVLPLLVISQAIPVFALAPILVLWFGYGMASKVAMAVLIIYFPVTASFYYGMQRTDPDLFELARVMDARPLAIMRYIVIPSALPAFASGIRVATAVAPIGAVVGEWVGSSEGLGFYMLHANARMQIDVMFAALTVLSIMALFFYFSIDYLLDKLIFWESKQGIM